MNMILVFGIILVISVLSCKPVGKIGLPTLVGFILIGVFIGNWYQFDDLGIVDHICTFALLLIVFTGGFQTNLSEVKPVLKMSVTLSVAGTLLTAGLTALFSFYVLNLCLSQSLLLGAILSATDVASVFSSLKSRHLNLKNNLDSVLTIESGSNEPFAHVLTVVLIAFAVGEKNIPLLLLVEFVVGAAAGGIVAKAGQYIINKLNFALHDYLDK